MKQEKIIETARKVLALAERGSEGEKKSATTMLERLMKKHNLTKEQLTLTEKQYKFKSLDPMKRRIIIQVIDSFDLPCYSLKGDKRRYLYTDCHEVTYLEVTAKINFYLKAWRDKVEIFMDAFISKNELWRPAKDTDVCDTVITSEMMEKYEKQMAMQESMESDVFYKTISNSKKSKK
jgi:hypothetical protein